MQFRLWIEASKNQLWLFEEDGYLALYHGIKGNTRQSREIGIIFYRFPRPDTVELEYIRVGTGNRRQGYARMLYEAFLNTIRTKHPNVLHVVARATSQRALNVHNRAL
ncbi:MAG: hypothetical protein KW793_05010, partial [Candidatus Doudnabacteria bacterium]|nr:hypothetical protein [Candidatus Doudnabacteria bacterium]